MTGNVGEWSELYTLFKLLADGKLYAADAHSNKIPDIYYDVLKVLRSDKDSKSPLNNPPTLKQTGNMIN